MSYFYNNKIFKMAIMGKIGCVISLFLLCACTPKSTSTDIPLDTDEKKMSYAIGHQFGQSLKAQNIKADVDVIAMSIRDVLSSEGNIRMTNEEMFGAIQNMRQQALEGQRKQAETNLKAGQDFLEKNKSKEGVTQTESGLQYQVEKMGDGPKPTADSVVKVHYKGTLISGEEFDSSYTRGSPAQFPVNEVIPGWTEALQLMPVGSKWKLFIPSQLAYGRQIQGKIPANSTLIFEVELLEIIQQAQPEGSSSKQPPSDS